MGCLAALLVAVAAAGMTSTTAGGREAAIHFAKTSDLDRYYNIYS